jgi:hypothetical protein
MMTTHHNHRRRRRNTDRVRQARSERLQWLEPVELPFEVNGDARPPQLCQIVEQPQTRSSGINMIANGVAVVIDPT